MAGSDVLPPEAGSISLPAWQADNESRLPDLLLAWFDRAGRVLPWRQNKDPYRIWLSEIMLQQTQVQTVIPYYERFLDRWPTIADLAAAADVQVFKLWEGLGYYSRARHLLQAARLVTGEWGGRMPDTEADLLRLPGIGAYTAGAILSIAFGRHVAAVDGNVVRVFARLAAVPWNPADPADRRLVRQWVLAVLPAGRPGDFNEALMDLGATVCLPRQPACSACPLAGICRGRLTGRLAELPRKTAAKAVPQEEKTVLVLTGPQGFHVNRRPAAGLLGDLFEFDWLDAAVAADWPAADQADPAGDFGLTVTRLAGHQHRFTHLVWILSGYHIALPAGGQDLSERHPADPVIGASLRRMLAGGLWVSAEGLADLPFPVALEPFRRQILGMAAGMADGPDDGQTAALVDGSADGLTCRVADDLANDSADGLPYAVNPLVPEPRVPVDSAVGDPLCPGSPA